MPELSGPVAGEPRERAHDVAVARRAGTWLAWWVLMMSFWVIIDDSIALDELLAGAGAAALAALLAEFAGHQAASRFRMRIEWLTPALSLPAEVAGDTILVFRALWDQLARGRPPRSGFREIPVRLGGDSVEGMSRRVLLTGGRSLAPNTFVLGLDSGRDVMVVHQLVVDQPRAPR